MRIIYIIFLLSGSYLLAQLNPSLPPGSNFDLSAWKLQTLDSNSNFVEISASQLKAGYTSSFFYTNTQDGSMVCKVPGNGGTTSGSSYPRVELRQMSKGANWALADTSEHYLSAQCKVITVAAVKPQIVIGQIHGGDNNSELIKLRWTGYQPGQCYIEARFQTNDSAGTEYGVTLANGMSLGDLITYSIRMKSGKITVTVNGSSGSQTYSTYYYGTTDRYYFKAGDYFQYNSSDPNIYGLTQFYKLSLTSPPLSVKDHIVSSDPGNSKPFRLNQNYPNPFNPSTNFNYYLLVSCNVKLIVYDMLGKEIATIAEGYKPAGDYNVQFDASNLPGGIYFYTIFAGTYSETRKLVLIK